MAFTKAKLNDTFTIFLFFFLLTVNFNITNPFFKFLDILSGGLSVFICAEIGKKMSK